MNSKQISNLMNTMFLGLLAGSLAACDHSGGTFSILNASQNFSQNASVVNNKVDILWVVDNSSSMQPLQTNLVNNFGSFMTNFQSKGYDYHIAVTTSDAYLAGSFWDNNSALSVFKDGVGSTHTGVFVINPLTDNVITTFVTNANQGQTGSGDERVFSSFKAALSNPTNSDFLRSDSFLSVIILSDEDDFSDPTRVEGSWTNPGGIPDHDYADPNLETVSSYESFLDTLTGSTPSSRRYNVSAITVLDSNCQATHAQDSPSTIIGQRYIQMVNDTNGTLGSVCDASYANSLNLIQEQIVELSTQFKLNRVPDPTTISVIVNGQVVPQDATNGWSYSAATNSLIFHGTAVPSQGASIQVNFTPTTAQS